MSNLENCTVDTPAVQTAQTELTIIVRCWNCDAEIDKSAATTHCGKFYCPDCMESGFLCYECGCYTDNDDKITYDRKDYCNDCFNEKYTVCEHCNETI